MRNISEYAVINDTMLGEIGNLGQHFSKMNIMSLSMYDNMKKACHSI